MVNTEITVSGLELLPDVESEIDETRIEVLGLSCEFMAKTQGYDGTRPNEPRNEICS